MKILVLDIEIEKMVEDLPNGWDDARQGLAGVSCVCIYDSDTERIHVYNDHPKSRAACIDHLGEADMLVTFNGIGFDIPALEGSWGIDLSDKAHYDILHEIWNSHGRKVKGYRLAEVGPRTILREKSGTGEHAPQLFAEGRWAELVDYCINDVYMTLDLFNYIICNGCVVAPDGGDCLVSVPDVETVI